MTPFGDLSPVRAHLLRCKVARLTWREVGAAAGVDEKLVASVARGHLDVLPYDQAAALLAVKVPTDDRPVRWTERAECARPWVHLLARSHGCASVVEMFFEAPGVGERGSAARDSALTVCRVCAVRDECLEYALAAPYHVPEGGVWGGTTEQERRKMKRSKR